MIKKSRKLKFLILGLVLFLFQTRTIFAYDPERSINLCMNDIKFSVFKYTGFFTKTTYGQQAIKLPRVWTDLTDPCPKCIIGIVPFDDYGNKYYGITLSMGADTKFWDHIGTEMPGNYKLGFMREDWTLLNLGAYVEFSWFLD